jgi:UDP-2,4-diacetamido-2,4,6-trideoxy-beta-L-altropyranose hydrolase
MSKRLLIRADSSSSIGVGHIKRCLTLSSSLVKEGIEVVFATQKLNGNINHEIVSSGYKIIYILEDNSFEVSGIINNGNFDVVVFDHYNIDKHYERAIKNTTSAKIVSFDDMYNPHECDILINHSIDAKKQDYKDLVSNETIVLCGSKYTLLRDEFFNTFDGSKFNKAKDVLVLFGGADPQNYTAKVIKYLNGIGDFNITAITTSANSHISILEDLDITLLVDVDNIATIMKKAEFIITTSGGTLLEVISQGVAFINIQIASNQSSIVEYLSSLGLKTSIKELNQDNLKEAIGYLKNNHQKIKNLLEKFEFDKDMIAKVIHEKLY